jgi:hypothetical protein
MHKRLEEFIERRRDRRRNRSFRGHFNRIRKQKGLLRVVAPLAGTAVVAAALFANCSGESLTGPTSIASAGTVSSPVDKPSSTWESEDSDGFKLGVVVRDYIDNDVGEPNPCYPADLVPYHGWYEAAEYVSPTDASHHHIAFHYYFDGRGSTSQVKYHGDEKYREDFYVRLGTADEYFSHKVRMISSGPTIPDYYLTMKAHIRIGGVPPQVIASVENVHAACVTSYGTVDP